MTESTIPQPVSQCADCSDKGYTKNQCPRPAIERGRQDLHERESWLSSDEFAVMWFLLELAETNHNVGHCSVPLPWLMEKTGFTKKTVYAILTRLAKYGWVKRVAKGDARNHIAAKYHILPHATSWRRDGSQTVRTDIKEPRPPRRRGRPRKSGTEEPGYVGSVTYNSTLRVVRTEEPGSSVPDFSRTNDDRGTRVPLSPIFCAKHGLEVHEPGNPDSWMDEAEHISRFEPLLDSCIRGPWVVG